jgi:epsilon-lactone hydrolase
VKALPLPLFLLLLHWGGRRKRFESVQGLRAAVAMERRVADAAPPADFETRYSLRQQRIEGSVCYSMAPLVNPSPTAVMYLHGGAHVAEMSSHHWNFLAQLVDSAACTVHVPIYPLAPENTYQAAHRVMLALYRQLAAASHASDLVLMGDSSGGGLATSLAQQLGALDLPQPRDIVLISPWLDLTVSGAEAARAEKSDPWLAVAGLAEAGRWWAGSEDPAAPHLSPINGSLEGLAPITIFIGSRDLLKAECQRLREQAIRQGVPVDWREEKGMIHVWPLLPLRKSRLARSQISDIVRSR